MQGPTDTATGTGTTWVSSPPADGVDANAVPPRPVTRRRLGGRRRRRPEPDVRSIGRLLRTAPRAVWLLVALQLLLCLCWSVLTPLFHAPDEPNHAEAVMRLETGQGWARIGDAFVGPAGFNAIVQSPFGTPARPTALDGRPIKQSDTVPRSERPTWAELATRPAPDPGPLQQIVEHPPGYYCHGPTSASTCSN